MIEYWVLGGIIVLIFLYMTYRNKQKIKKTIRERWGIVPRPTMKDSFQSISDYWRKRLEHQPPKYYIDNLTWNDLDMYDVYKRLNSTYSSVGAEYLFDRLHDLKFDTQEMSDFEKLVGELDSNDPAREKILYHLYKLGKQDNNNVCEFIFSPKERRLHHHYIYPILASILLSSLLFMIVSWQYALFAVIPSVIINSVIFYKKKYQLDSQLEAVRYITSIVVCAGKLSRIKDEKLQFEINFISKLYKKLKKISGLGNSVLSQPMNELGFGIEILKALFMYDFLCYNRIVSTLSKNNEDFHQLWKEIGKIDSAISIASYRRTIEFYITPTFIEDNSLIAKEVYHPLIDDPVCNPAAITKNSVITGSNAAGKSTYIKTLAINCIFAQTINTCLARSFCFKPSIVVTSMAVRDSVIDGDSYFIAELNSLKRILRYLNDEVLCMCFIDEILKGTNTIERIAASASILKWFSSQNCLCVVASHDIELTDILDPIYDNYHFRGQITDDGILFDYMLQSGRTTTRNAIKLLEFMDYPSEVFTEAQARVKNFEITHKWEKT